MSRPIDVRNTVDDAYQLYIDGKWTQGSGSQTISSYNPSNGEKLADFVDATHEDVDQAVAAAQKLLKHGKRSM